MEPVAEIITKLSEWAAEHVPAMMAAVAILAGAVAAAVKALPKRKK